MYVYVWLFMYVCQIYVAWHYPKKYMQFFVYTFSKFMINNFLVMAQYYDDLNKCVLNK